MHCVDLGERFQTIFQFWLQRSAAIQPKTSPVKFAHSPCTDSPYTESRFKLCGRYVKDLIATSVQLGLASSNEFLPSLANFREVASIQPIRSPVQSEKLP